MMIAEVITTGTELLLGQIVNTNARFLSEKLAEKGIDVYWQTVVGDNPARLEETLSRAISRSDIIIATGVIGPHKRRPDKGNTGKDFGTAACNKLNMAKKYGRNVQAARLGNDRQQPETGAAAQGARLLYNDFGTAPGIWLEHQDKIPILLPVRRGKWNRCLQK